MPARTASTSVHCTCTTMIPTPGKTTAMGHIHPATREIPGMGCAGVGIAMAVTAA